MIDTSDLRGKVAWLLQDMEGVDMAMTGADGSHPPALPDEDALYMAGAVLDLIEAEKILGAS